MFRAFQLLVIENNYEDEKKHAEHLQNLSNYLSRTPGGGYTMVERVRKDYIFKRNRVLHTVVQL
jgi:hypothetical protein